MDPGTGHSFPSRSRILQFVQYTRAHQTDATSSHWPETESAAALHFSLQYTDQMKIK